MAVCFTTSSNCTSSVPGPEGRPSLKLGFEDAEVAIGQSKIDLVRDGICQTGYALISELPFIFVEAEGADVEVCKVRAGAGAERQRCGRCQMKVVQYIRHRRPFSDIGFGGKRGVVVAIADLQLRAPVAAEAVADAREHGPARVDGKRLRVHGEPAARRIGVERLDDVQVLEPIAAAFEADIPTVHFTGVCGTGQRKGRDGT